jgi:hypothetical protein
VFKVISLNKVGLKAVNGVIKSVADFKLGLSQGGKVGTDGAICRQKWKLGECEVLKEMHRTATQPWSEHYELTGSG